MAPHGNITGGYGRHHNGGLRAIGAIHCEGTQCWWTISLAHNYWQWIFTPCNWHYISFRFTRRHIFVRLGTKVNMTASKLICVIHFLLFDIRPIYLIRGDALLTLPGCIRQLFCERQWNMVRDAMKEEITFTKHGYRKSCLKCIWRLIWRFCRLFARS